MKAALALARRGLGQVAPNPAVGCVLVKDGQVVGRGWTQPGGRPHAETEALARAGAASNGATAYITLEPCAHHGQTPPCADALVAAGVTRCLVAIKDPDSRVAGKGLTKLRHAGVEVEVGLLSTEAAELNAGFLSRVTQGRPLVTLKLATTLDGKIATAGGESRWITGPEARSRAHLLRAEHDAILVGSGTALADNPRLDVRLPGLAGRRPLRVVLDGGLRLPAGHDLVIRSGEQSTLAITSHDHDAAKAEALRKAGCEVLPVQPDDAKRPGLPAALEALAERGVNQVLVEGGGQIAAAFLKADLVDRLTWFRAPKVIGGEGIGGIAELGLKALGEAPAFDLVEVLATGQDRLEIYRRSR